MLPKVCRTELPKPRRSNTKALQELYTEEKSDQKLQVPSLQLHAAPQCTTYTRDVGNVGCRGRDCRPIAFPTRLLRACISPLSAFRRTDAHAVSAPVEFGVAKDSTKSGGRRLIRGFGSGKVFRVCDLTLFRVGRGGATDIFPSAVGMDTPENVNTIRLQMVSQSFLPVMTFMRSPTEIHNPSRTRQSVQHHSPPSTDRVQSSSLETKLAQ